MTIKGWGEHEGEGKSHALLLGWHDLSLCLG